MKKLIAIMLAMLMVLSLAACGETKEEPKNDEQVNNEQTNNEQTNNEDEVTVMTWDEYMAAELDAEVVVECYVQGHQSWWDNKITVYAQDDNGGYFMYEMACSEEDAEKLVPGTKIRVTGVKAEWSGEVEIVDATFEIIADDTKIYEAEDVTALLGTDELLAKQNMFVAFKGVTLKEVAYKNDEPGDDIYVTVTSGDADYSFCVEMYLTGPETDVYKAFETLEAGTKVDIEGFAYWYEGINTHITSIAVAE